MIVKILDRFEKVLIHIQQVDTFFESENDLEVLKMTCIDFAKFTYLKQGNLFILAQLMDEFRSKEIDYIEHNIFFQDSLDLISKYNFNNIQYFSLPIAEKRAIKNMNNKQLVDLKYKIKEEQYHKMWQLKFETKSQIKTKYNYLKSQIFTYLDLMFFQNNEFRNKIEPFDLDVVSEDKIKFYDSWHFGRASLEKWIKFPTTEFLDVPIYQKRNITEKVEKIQQSLFQKALQNELNELLSALAKGNKIINFKRFLDLSENFINGNLNSIDLKRFSVFMNFDRADEVLIELDNILMEKEINFRKYLPYDGPNKIKSPRFAAELILLFGSECTKTLKLYANKGWTCP